MSKNEFCQCGAPLGDAPLFAEDGGLVCRGCADRDASRGASSLAGRAPNNRRALWSAGTIAYGAAGCLAGVALLVWATSPPSSGNSSPLDVLGSFVCLIPLLAGGGWILRILGADRVVGGGQF